MLLIEKNDPHLSVVQQCKILQLNRSRLYYAPVPESELNLQVMRWLDEQYFKTPFYGARKLTVELNKQGFKVNIKRVRRLMEKINWRTIYREPKTTVCNKAHPKYPYLLNNLQITSTNQVWAADITYIPMKKGFMYLTAIIDLHSRYVIHWDISNCMSSEWCAQLLQHAIDRHGKPQIFNTDQGSQYTSDVHTKILIDNNIQISMDGKGRALDNIFIERLWRSVKYENVYLQSYENGLALYNGLKNYFNFYNNERLHQSLDYQTPQYHYFNRCA